MENFELENIENRSCREFFSSILQEYYSENYRSCIVSLYSLIIYDLVQKIIENINATNDIKLKEIKQNIDNSILLGNKKYSDIEKDVVESLYSNKKIGNIFNRKIENLRNERNDCAHFGLYENRLYVPSKEITYDFLLFFYNEQLSKSYLMLSNIKDIVLEKIEKYYSSEFYDIDIEEDRNKIKKEMDTLIDVSYNDKTIDDLFKSLFELLILKNNEDCKKYRKYTYISFLTLLEYLKEHGQNDKIDKSIYRKLDIKILEDSYYEPLQFNPLLELLEMKLLKMDDIHEKNDIFYEAIRRYVLSKPYYLNKYWNLVFDSAEELNDYLRNENYNIDFVIYIKAEDIEESTLFNACINSLSSVPTFGGFLSAIAFFDIFERIYKHLNEEHLKECLQLINSNSQFYTSDKVKQKLKPLEEYIKESTNINISDYSNLFKDAF